MKKIIIHKQTNSVSFIEENANDVIINNNVAYIHGTTLINDISASDYEIVEINENKIQNYHYDLVRFVILDKSTSSLLLIGYDKFLEKQREKRNKLLLETDWTQTSDSPLTTEKKQEFLEYRQKLRDLFYEKDGIERIKKFPNVPSTKE